MDARVEEVLSFWFEGDAKARGERWFRRDPVLDQTIRGRFGPLIAEALRGDRDDWAASPRGALALVVLLDQLTRNIHRGSPDSLAGDARALAVSDALRSTGRDQELSFDERYVALMPTMHAEDLEVQRRGLEGFRTLVSDATAAGASEGQLEQLRSAADYAERHLAIIERFGRFPHRNAVLGRTSTEEEIEFLKQAGSSF